VDESLRTEWDEWNPAEQDPSVKERVEMSFDTVRLEKVLGGEKGGVTLQVGSREAGRSVSNGSDWSVV
jgi:hypothetical protein